MFRSISLSFVIFLVGCSFVPDKPGLLLSSEIKEEILKQDVVLIGERHDNKQHHDIQGQIIDFLRSEHRLGHIYLEHLNTERAQALQETPPKTAEEFAKVTSWEESGWPSFEVFSGLFESLVKGGSLQPIGIDREVLMQLYQGKDPGLISSNASEVMALDKKLPEDKHERLLKVLLDSHCGQLSESHGEAMLNLQRYRDAYMAYRYEQIPGKIAVYLIGAGHSNKFYGVPHYLAKLHPNLKLLSIELSEPGSSALADESDRIIGTQKAEREDPCANFSIRKSKSES